MKIPLVICLAMASPTAAQTPLCAWNGTSLSCPNQPVPQGPLTPAQPFKALPTPQQRLAELQAQADFDRTLIAARTAQDAKLLKVLEQADGLIAAGSCPDAETLVREKAPTEIATVTSRCAARK
ncbi:hypothetical protein [Sphingomonas sp. CGMCC 1.13658]|nr:hypothetical protein [Sphingomonas sp. CGMCC 1.13658]MBA2918447.1 hypothetical protein [Sphingomonas sp. CGMCC 1.13658]